MEHNILLNNAVNIYDHYFDDMIPTTLTTEREIRYVSYNNLINFDIRTIF